MTDSKVEKSTIKPGKKKGAVKTGGRKKGTPNKKTSEFLEALGSFDPVNKLIELFSRTKDDNIKLKICTECLKYIYPQRKAVEMTTEESGFTININRKAVKSNGN